MAFLSVMALLLNSRGHMMSFRSDKPILIYPSLNHTRFNKSPNSVHLNSSTRFEGKHPEIEFAIEEKWQRMGPTLDDFARSAFVHMPAKEKQCLAFAKTRPSKKNCHVRSCISL